MSNTMTVPFRRAYARYYLRCTSCKHEFTSSNRDRRCPLCFHEAEVWGVKVVEPPKRQPE